MKLARSTLCADACGDLVSRDRRGVLEELAGKAAALGCGVPAGEIARRLVEREEQGSTAIGGGVALPHARLAGIVSPRLLVGRSARGVDFSAEDRAPVHVFLLLVSPEGDTDGHLGTLARLTRILRDEAVLRSLRDDGDPALLLRVIREEDAHG